MFYHSDGKKLINLVDYLFAMSLPTKVVIFVYVCMY